jgi:hypothetical protein
MVIRGCEEGWFRRRYVPADVAPGIGPVLSIQPRYGIAMAGKLRLDYLRIAISRYPISRDKGSQAFPASYRQPLRHAQGDRLRANAPIARLFEHLRRILVSNARDELL